MPQGLEASKALPGGARSMKVRDWICPLRVRAASAPYHFLRAAGVPDGHGATPVGGDGGKMMIAQGGQG